jgi:hypothetical protein
VEVLIRNLSGEAANSVRDLACNLRLFCWSLLARLVLVVENRLRGVRDCRRSWVISFLFAFSGKTKQELKDKTLWTEVINVQIQKKLATKPNLH